MSLLLRLLLRNAYRHRLRTTLVQIGVSLAICAFGLLRTVVDAWYAGPQAASGTRLITRSAVSMVGTLPLHYAEQIRAMDGVVDVSWRNWFAATYVDPSQFFAQFAVDGPSNFRLSPELVVDAQALRDFEQDRSGAIVGAKLQRKYGWKVGDQIALEGTIYPGMWRFTVRGVYRGADANTDEQQMFIHWQRVADSVRLRAPAEADQVGVFLVGIRDAASAASVAQRIDALFRNSSAETLTETEKAFKLGIVSMSDTILRGIDAVSVIVILTVMSVMANTMALSSRERLSEFATLNALGFSPRFVAGLLLGESMAIALLGASIGVALTFPVAKAFGSAVALFPVFRVSTTTVGLQFLASAAVGVVAALWPAWTLSRLDVVQALRHGH